MVCSVLVFSWLVWWMVVCIGVGRLVGNSVVVVLLIIIVLLVVKVVVS